MFDRHGSVEFVRAVYVFGDFSAFFAVFKYGVDSVGSVKVAMEFGLGKVVYLGTVHIGRNVKVASDECKCIRNRSTRVSEILREEFCLLAKFFMIC